MRRLQIVRWAPVWLACLAATAQAQLSQAQLSIVKSKPAILRNGAGAARFVLSNAGKTALPLSLNAGTFLDETSQAKLPAPRVTFALEAGGGDLPAQIGPGQSLQIVASVSNMASSTAASAKLFNQLDEIGELNAVAVDVPLNITLEGNGTPEKPLKFAYGRTVAVTLKNGGTEFFSLDWRFQLGGTVVASGSIEKNTGIILTPNGLTRILLSPPKEVYSWKDFVRPTERNGLLLVTQHGPHGVSNDLLPVQSIPVNLTMMRMGPDQTEVLFAIYVMVFLLIGGLLSLLGSSVLPSVLRKIALHRQISDLADRTSSVSARVDSYLRVLLRLERAKIGVALDEVGPLSLSSAERFEDVAVSIDRLAKRLTVAERLDELRRRFQDASATAPPSITDDIDRTLQAASNQLHSFSLPDEDVNAANVFLSKAEASLALLDDSGAQAKLIAANFKQLKDRLTPFPEALYDDLKQALPGIFAFLDFQFDDPANIVRPMFFAIDHAIAAIHAALDYTMVRVAIPVVTPSISGDPGKNSRDRLLEHEPELIKLLGTLSWKSLRAATTLVQEMREDIYESDVLAEIGKQRADGERRVRVEFDTQKARPYLPVYFSIDFDDPRFCGAAALSKLAFRWSFPGDLTEEGARVCHYFLGDEPLENESEANGPEHKKSRKKKFRQSNGRKVKIVVSVQSHRDLEAADTIEGVLEIQPPKPRQATRAFAEGVRFLIAFGVALAGLEAGALDQLGKLDFFPATLAVVALGFGADSVKNLLTQTPKKNGSTA
ncbi:MAG: hypothetical protein ABSC76_08025 [Terracidiphilus sp.]|jgi:hypothetical protein